MNILESLISLAAPHDCIVCDLEGELLCGSCLESELIETASRCYRCHKTSPNQAVCPDCRRSVSMNHVWIATDYGKAPKKLVHKFKFERAIAAAGPIAEKIGRTIPYLSQDTVVCHVPTANSRVRMRGYDQAAEIAKNFAKLRGYKHKALLLRKGRSRQVGSGRTDRFKHLEDAFQANDNLKQMDILLVDDVTTTGATIEAAAKTLKKAGAKTVNAAVFAQPG